MVKVMISLDGIEKIVKKGDSIVHALKGINLDIKQGEIFGILGRAGAGKSALIRCINLLDRPSEGSIIVDKCNLVTLSNEGLRNARKNIGMIFQHFNLLSSRTVFDNIALPLEISGCSKEEIQSNVLYLLEITQLLDKANHYPNQLNTGQKQRVAIARALVHRPKVLLCEEATMGLDPKTKQSILQLLKEINLQLNLTIVLITHELDVIKSICHRAAVMHQGKIVEEGTVLEILSKPITHITQEFIKSAARADLPTALRHRLRPTSDNNCHPILRISFAGDATKDPFFVHFIQRYNLSVNIIQAHLETIQEGKIGIMIAELIGEAEEIKRALLSLEHTDLHIEVLGYAPRIT